MIAENIREMIRAGHDPKQAAAAAYREAGVDCDLTEDEIAAFGSDSAIIFAIDQASVRRRDQDGRLHVELTNISKATVNPYWGREIPGAAELGLDPDTVYQVFRDPVALEAGAASFNNIQLMDDHIIVQPNDPKKDRIVGSTGTDATFDGVYLKNSLVVWDARSIERIENGEQREISCAYRYDARLESGEFMGLPYTVVMSNIVGNHVALVKEGRAGPDVVVADSAIVGEQSKMAKFSVIKGALAAKFATDSAIDRADRPYLMMALDELEETVEAEDEEIEEVEIEAKAKDKAKDRKAKDEKAAEDARRAKDKKAKDEESDAPETVEDSDEDDDKAMDAKIKLATDAAIAAYSASRDALDQAKLDVQPHVGVVHGMDSAEAVYRFALDSAKVDHAGINELAALRGMVKMIPAPGSETPRPVAMDSASRGAVAQIIPALSRFA